MKGIQPVLNRCLFLYMGVSLLLWGIVDHRRVILRTLDYFPAVPPFMVRYAQTQENDSFYVRGPEALRYYKNLVKLFPNSATVQSNLAFCYFQMEDYDRAARYYEKAVGLEPKLFGLHYDLGVTYLFFGEFDKALSSFKKAVKVDPVSTLTYPAVIDPFQIERKGEGNLKTAKVQAVKAGYVRSYQMIKLLSRKDVKEKIAHEQIPSQLYYYLPVYQRSVLSNHF